MNKRIRRIALASSLISTVLLLSACNDSNGNSTETKTANESQPSKAISQGPEINLETYKLPNGLDVVLHQDSSDPIVAAAIVYHVGSNREKPGRTGFAHFFEHMLFQDSENVGPGQFIKNIGAMGGILNGGTWYDGTIYYEVFPKNALEQVLWMESDRMGYFINTITQEGLENEKQVVKNEKRQRVDNRPYGHTNSVISKSLYPKGHPYSWSVIGSLEDLQNATLADVREFYEKWYGINNATLVLAGDFESKQAKAWIKKYFGDFEPRGNVEPLPPMPANLAQSKSFYHEDNFAKVSELTLTFPTVEQYSEQSYALDLLADILSDGKQSVLYKQVVEKDKLAANVSVSHDSYEIAGTLRVTVRAFDGVDLDQVEQSVLKGFDEFKKTGFSKDQQERLLTQRVSEFYNNITSVFNKAAALATYNEFAGDPNLLVTEIDRYKAVTKDQIISAFNTFIDQKPRIKTSFVPKGGVELALNDAVKADVVEEKIVQGAEDQLAKAGIEEAKKLEPVPNPKSSFDRSVKPDFAGNLNISLPDIWETSLDNGIRVIGIEHTELPLVSFSIRIMGGHLLDSKEKNGVANLLTSIMMEGTKTKTPEQFTDELGKLGSTLRFTTSGEYVTLTGSSLSKNFDETMALAQELLLEPRWDETQWQRIKQQTSSRILQSAANPDSIASNVFAKLMYDSKSMLSTPISGSQESVEAITLDDVKAFYTNNISSTVTSVHVSGDVKLQQVKNSLKRLGTEMNSAPVTIPKAIDKKELDKPQLYFVDVPGAKQSVLRIGRRAMDANSSEFYPGVAVNHNLGGSFSARLFQVLRLQKGYTYGAYSQFERYNSGSQFNAGSSVRANVTLESLQLFREIMSQYVDEFDLNALVASQSTLTKSQARSFETTSRLMQVLENVTTYDLDTNYVAKEQDALKALDLEKARHVLREYVNPDAMVYLVVGDAKTQLPRMAELGIGNAQVLDVHGQPVTTN